MSRNIKTILTTKINSDVYHVVERREAHEPLPIMFHKGDDVEVLEFKHNDEFMCGRAALVKKPNDGLEHWIDMRFLSKHHVEWNF